MTTPKTHYISDHEVTLTELQELVGGYIEVAVIKILGKTKHIIFNDEGKLLNLPVNIEATEVWLGKDRKRWKDEIVGDAVVLTESALLT